MVTAKQASIEFALHWQCALAHHTDRLYFEKINFWRDFFPGLLSDQLAGLSRGRARRNPLPPASWFPLTTCILFIAFTHHG